MPYTIGEVARMMNIAPSTLRYYEKEGLLSLGVRASNGSERTQTTILQRFQSSST